MLRAVSGLVVCSLALAAAPQRGPASEEAGPRFTREGVRVRLLAPGMIIELYGEHLGPTPWCAANIPQNGPYPTEACGVRVSVGSTRAGLLFVGEKQINLKIPADAPEEGAAPVQVCVGDRCSDPVTFRFSVHKSYIAVQGKAYVHMPIWIEAEQPAGFEIYYPYQVWPWDFGGYTFEVRRDGQPLPALERRWERVIGGLVGGTVAPQDSPRSRLPLHLVYQFDQPGVYEARLSAWRPVPPDYRSRNVATQSDWTKIVVEPFTEAQRAAWLRTVAAKVAGATPGELVGDLIPSLLAWPDERALHILLPLRHHGDDLVRQFASQSLAAFDQELRLRGSGRIVYEHAPEGGEPWPLRDIYSTAGDGSQVVALTTDGYSHTPAWSPDGRRILFIHDAALGAKPAYREQPGFESHHPVELYVMNRDGSERKLLRRLEPAIYSAAWSPDGKTLAVTCLPEGSGGNPAAGQAPRRAGLFLLPADGVGAPRFLLANAFTPSWSPNGRKLAFSVEGPRGQWAVHVAGQDGSGDVRLTDPSRSGGSPAWSPDGKQIAFDQFVDRGQQVFIMDADGAHARQLTGDPNWSCGHPSWSPDGGRLAISCRSAGSPCGMVSSTGSLLPACARRIFTLSLDDSKAKPIPIHGYDGASAAFAPVP